RKATRNRVQFTNDESALKTLWLMICTIEDKRAAKRAKQGKRVGQVRLSGVSTFR
nr:IS256 family transposase [Corynebacterium sp. MSK189]MDK8737101.1 IS256 family transposase [Corynebacterium sp. MSK306]